MSGTSEVQRIPPQPLHGSSGQLFRLPQNPLAVARLRNKVKRLRRQVAELRKRVYLDSLTNVYSRAYLERAVRTIRQWPWHGSESLACFVVDIDDFKQVNDSHGHLLGDQVLAFVGRTVKNCMGRNAIVIRFGGDEFLIFLKEFEVGTAEAIASEISDLVALRRWSGRQGSVEVSVSIGGAVIEPNRMAVSASVISALICSADEAMYEAKQYRGVHIRIMRRISCRESSRV